MNSAEVEHVKSKIENVLQDLKEFQNQVFKIYTQKNDLILDLAKYKERLTELGERKEPITTISYEIKKLLFDMGFENADSWVQKVLPSKYKDPKKAAAGRARHEGEEKPAGLILQNEEPSKPIAIMDREELREYAEKKVERVRELKRRAHDEAKEADEVVKACEEKGIALQVGKKKEPISTEKDPRESASHKALEELCEIVESLTKKVYEMPPMTPEDDAEICAAVENFIQYLKPLQDEKWSKSFLAWLKIQLENIAYGKHAAGSRAATSVLIVETKKKPDGTEYEESHIEQRKLTKEQVGDRLQEILEIAAKLTGYGRVPVDEMEQEDLLKKALEQGESSEFIKALSYVWHGKSAEPRIAKRKVELHETLSEQA